MKSPEYVSPKRFWSKFGVAPSTTYRWIREGRIRAIQLGKRYMIPRDELDRIESEGLAEPCEEIGATNSTDR